MPDQSGRVPTPPIKVHPCGCRSFFDEEAWASVLSSACPAHVESGRTASRSSYQAEHVEDWIRALNAASCCGTPDPNALTVREWGARAANYPPLPLRTRIGIRVAEAISCPACFRLRLSPGHLLFCGGSL